MVLGSVVPGCRRDVVAVHLVGIEPIPESQVPNVTFGHEAGPRWRWVQTPQLATLERNIRTRMSLLSVHSTMASTVVLADSAAITLHHIHEKRRSSQNAGGSEQHGAPGLTRTDTSLPIRDFESRASTNSATGAVHGKEAIIAAGHAASTDHTSHHLKPLWTLPSRLK